MADSRERELAAVRAAVTDYLEGMIYGQPDRLRQAFHPAAVQAGHYRGQYEFFDAEAFIASLAHETMLPAGSPYEAEIQFIDMTGDVAVVKVMDACFGTRFTDYLTLIRHEGRWQIVCKAFFDHAESA